MPRMEAQATADPADPRTAITGQRFMSRPRRCENIAQREPQVAPHVLPPPLHPWKHLKLDPRGAQSLSVTQVFEHELPAIAHPPSPPKTANPRQAPVEHSVSALQTSPAPLVVVVDEQPTVRKKKTLTAVIAARWPQSMSRG